MFYYWISMAVPIFMIVTGFNFSAFFLKRELSTLKGVYQPAIIKKRIISYTISFLLMYLLELVIEKDSDYITSRIEPLEEVIDDMVLLLKNRHTERLCQGICSINSGLIFMEILTQFECTADQCSNIAMQILGRKNEDITKNLHLYLEELHASSDQSYLAEKENRRVQYLVPLLEDQKE